QLRLERNKEYNQYLREKEEWNEKLKIRKVGKKNPEHETERNKIPVAATRLQPDIHTQIQSSHRDPEPVKKDVFTSTDAYEELLNRAHLEENQYRRLDNESELRGKIPHQKIEDLDVSNRNHHKFDSRLDIPTRRHHRFDGDRESDKRNYQLDYNPQINEEMDPRFRYESDYDKKPLRVFHVERSSPTNESKSPTGKDGTPYAAGLILG
uniref:Centrosome and spindle pole associated protein 1 n=1 Tax=Sphenodon punctatus TaxID=8508 RepID=A0A8D0G1K3_SPHPU